MDRLKTILSGESSINLNLDFLCRNNHTDLLILKNIKTTVDQRRSSVLHSATLFTNALMHAGTTIDTFLRDNLEWLGTLPFIFVTQNFFKCHGCYLEIFSSTPKMDFFLLPGNIFRCYLELFSNAPQDVPPIGLNSVLSLVSELYIKDISKKDKQCSDPICPLPEFQDLHTPKEVPSMH
jgi:hypothetical protein